MSKLLTIEDVCERLNVSRPTINRWIASKAISFIKLGKCVRFREDHLESWLDKKTIKAQKKTA